MNTTSFETSIEPRWKTYLWATVFLLPPVIFYWTAFVCVVPKFKELWMLAKIDMAEIGWGWHIPFFLAEHGLLIFVTIIAALALLELLSKRMWTRYRRVTGGIMVWVLNVYVLLSFGCFFLLAVMAAQGLAHPK